MNLELDSETCLIKALNFLDKNCDKSEECLLNVYRGLLNIDYLSGNNKRLQKLLNKILSLTKKEEIEDYQEIITIQNITNQKILFHSL